MPKHARHPKVSFPAKAAQISSATAKLSKHLKRTERSLSHEQTYAKETKILSKLQRAGTLGDKVTALVLKVQGSRKVAENYLDFQAMEHLFTIAGKQSRRDAESAITALKELFTDHLLPNYPLKSLSQTTEADLKLAFEATIKSAYARFIAILAKQLTNTVVHFKQHIIKVMADMAALKPEGQSEILSTIVNKLGDPDTAVPTSIVLELNHLIRHISTFVFRPHQPSKSLFYAIVLLNSLKVREGEQDAIQLMIQTCLKLFPSLVDSTDNTKTLALLLQAANKLFAVYSKKADLDFFAQEIDSLYRLTHLKTNQIVQLQALRFVFQAERAIGTISDRYYRTLYEHVLPHPRLRDVNPKTLSVFFNTLLISVREDTVLSRVQAFLKRMLMCCLITDTHFICGMLLIVSEVLQTHKGAWTMLTAPPDDDEEERYQDVPDSDDEPRPQIDGEKKAEILTETSRFDAFKREPKFSGGSYACLWELNVLSHHFHPTVRKWAKSLLAKQPLAYDGDPLLDFSMVNFLERFSYQSPKPKQLQKLQGRVRMSLVKESVNSDAFADLDESAVREEELFFKQYFKLRGKREKRQELEAKTDSEESGEDEEEGGEGFDFSDLEDGGDEDVSHLLEEEVEDADEPQPQKRKKLPMFADASEYEHLLTHS